MDNDQAVFTLSNLCRSLQNEIDMLKRKLGVRQAQLDALLFILDQEEKN